MLEVDSKPNEQGLDFLKVFPSQLWWYNESHTWIAKRQGNYYEFQARLQCKISTPPPLATKKEEREKGKK